VKIALDHVLVQDPEPRAADIGQGLAVLSLRAGYYFDFNPVAADIWAMLAKPCRVSEIFAALSGRHEIDAQIFERDVTPFLQVLLDERLIRVLETDDAR
jgi:hypothetical protein